MAVSCKVGEFQTGVGAATTTVVVNGVGFLPKVVIFLWTGLTAESNSEGNHKYGSGYAISTTDRGGVTSQSEHAAATSAADTQTFDDAAVKMLDVAGAVDGALDHQSMDADGFTLVVDVQFATDRYVTFLALGGADLTDFVGLTITPPVGSGIQDVATIALDTGKDDKCVIFFGGSGTAINTTVVDSSFSMGFAAEDDPVSAVLAGWSDDALADSVTRSYSRLGECFSGQLNASSPTVRAVLRDWLSTGFRLNWFETGTRPVVRALVMKGPRFRIRGTLTETVINKRISAPARYKGRGGVVLSNGQADSIKDVTASPDRRSIGFFSGPGGDNKVAAFGAIIDGSAEATTDIGRSAGCENLSSGFILTKLGTGADKTTVNQSVQLSARSLDGVGVEFKQGGVDGGAAHMSVLVIGDTEQTIGAKPDVDVELNLPPDPAPPAGMTAWWKANSIVGDDGSVPGTWPDSSAFGRTLTQATGAVLRKRSKRINERTAVQFDGVDDKFTTSATVADLLGPDGEGAIFIVFWPDEDVTLDGYLIRDATNQKFAVFSEPTDEKTAFMSSGVATWAARVTTTNNNPHLAFWFKHANAGPTPLDQFGGIDTVDDALLATVAAGAIDVLTGTVEVAGGTASQFFMGEIAEIIVYDTQLSQDDRRKVAYYLQKKYGMTQAWPNVTAPTGATDKTWTSVLPDLLMTDGMSLNYGMDGEDTSRVAGSGTWRFSLLNLASGVPGKWAPGHSLARHGFDVGTGARLKLTYDGATYYKFRGVVTDVDVVAGKERHAAHVTAGDWMEEAARTKVSGIPLQLNQRADQLFELILARVARQPEAKYVSGTTDTYAVALDNTQDEKTDILTEISKLVNSELGFCYVRRDKTTGEELVFESRRDRANKFYNSLVLDDATYLRGLNSTRSRNDIVNRVKVQGHPRKIDAAATTVLFTHNGLSPTSTLLYPAGAVLPTLICPFRDPAQPAVRIGGTELVNPVSGTDYLFNTLASGAGVNISSQLTVTITSTGNTVTFDIFNKGPLDGYLTKLQVRGKGVYSFESVVFEAFDQPSIDTNGENPISFDMPYQNSSQVGNEVASYLLKRGITTQRRVRSASYKANARVDLMNAMLAIEPGDRIGVTETTTGISQASEPRGFFVAGVSLAFAAPGNIDVTYALVSADDDLCWIFDKPGYHELDVSTIFGFGIFT